jgi:hypothetical protein
MMKPDTSRLAERGDLIALVAGKEEIFLSDKGESSWLEVIRKMDEVYSDLIGYETDLEKKTPNSKRRGILFPASLRPFQTCCLYAMTKD